MKLRLIEEGERFYTNGNSYRLVEEEDGWWSIYLWHEYRMEYIPCLQARDYEHAKSYCAFKEIPRVPYDVIE